MKHICVYLVVIISNKYTFIHRPVFPKDTFNGWREVWNLIGRIINLQDRTHKFVSSIQHYEPPVKRLPEAAAAMASQPVSDPVSLPPQLLRQNDNYRANPDCHKTGLVYKKNCKFRHDGSKLLKHCSRCVEQLSSLFTFESRLEQLRLAWATQNNNVQSPQQRFP